MRVYWAPAAGGQYGEMRALDGRRPTRRGRLHSPGHDGARRRDRRRTRALDALFRDTIVYLTCLHELGHALGLVHTADFEDVMYFFGFGGDITEFFGRYRRDARATRAIFGSVAGLVGRRSRPARGAVWPEVPKRELAAAN